MDELKELARLAGVEPAYEDVVGRVREASLESLSRVLQILGVPVERDGEVVDAMHRAGVRHRGGAGSSR